MGEPKEFDQKRTSVAAKGVVTGGIAVGLALFMALTANSVALWADFAATGLDFLAIAIAWWGLRKAEAGKTGFFNYGFGRFESLLSIGIALLMVISFLCILGAVVVRLNNPVPLRGIGVFIGVILHSIFGVINTKLAVQSALLEKREKTALISAQKRIFIIKATANICMFAALSSSYLLSPYPWSYYFDPAAAILISAMLLAGATKVFNFSVRDLLDCAIEEQSQLLIIRAMVHHFDQYEQIHEIRTRNAGGKVYVEIFLEFDPEAKHSSVMRTIQSISREIKNDLGFAEVLVIPAGKNG
ncbi:MAG: cation diffusion facilitator family transporter [Syntrophales bacterium]|jgi:cation diffusion facilitator family transporter|nr:cation diffusion facilitator family transporter [Syntrophales bacterium]